MAPTRSDVIEQDWESEVITGLRHVLPDRPADAEVFGVSMGQSEFVLLRDVPTSASEVRMDGEDWKRQLLSRLMGVAQLLDNWDHEGSPATNPALIAAAWELVTRLDPDDLPVPFVCPVPGGGFQFEWTGANKHLEIEFVDKDTILYLTEERLQQGERMDSGEYTFSDTDKTRRLLNWFDRSS